MEQIDINADMYFGKVDVNKILRGKLINFNLPLLYERSKNMSTYTIQWGDTLSGIAKKYNTDVNTLMGLNPYIKNANKIYAGKTLNLPGQQATQQPVQNTAPATQTTPVQAPAMTQTTTTPTKTTQQLAEEYAKQQTANTGNDTQALLNQYEKIAEQQKQALQQQQQ